MMELEVLSLVKALVLSALVLSLMQQWRRAKAAGRRLAPGPRAWPLVGNLHQLGYYPHRSLALMARNYGPIMALRLGAMPTLVVSSAAAAREMFREHDAQLAGRTLYEVMRSSSGNDGSVITAQHGPRWRMLRRLSTTGLFGAARLDAARGMRAACVASLVRQVDEQSARGSRAADLGRLLFRMAFNHTGNLVLSKDLLDLGSEEGEEFFHHACQIMELVGKPNVADFFPVFRGLDPQGIRRGIEFYIGRALAIVSGLVKERMEGMDKTCSQNQGKDLLQVLLEFEGDGVVETSTLSVQTISSMILEMFIAGTDTTAGTMEWVMAELLHNPSIMGRVQAELRQAIPLGQESDESDLMNLPYLRAVIYETLRLHPPLPFLVPHKAMESCNFFGYHIPKGTQVLVNVWGIARDPDSWEHPEAFKPERFITTTSQVDYKGQYFEFIPFGSGRRMCPAIPFASRLLPLVIGTLLHSFDWVLPNGQNAEAMDMTEHMGSSLRKTVPLRAIPKPYGIKVETTAHVSS